MASQGAPPPTLPASHLHHTAPPKTSFQPAPLRPLRQLPLTWAQPQKQHEGPAGTPAQRESSEKLLCRWKTKLVPRSPLTHSCKRRETHALTPRGSEGSRSGWEETVPTGPPLQVLMTRATLCPENPEGTEEQSRGAQQDPAAKGPREQGLLGTKPTGRASVVMAEAPDSTGQA